ncbi:MAG TPA: glycosyltransferase [Polyangiaceae bacterium]|nr:glycosyltransferase [Polyangiaceae bacterium]
MLSTIGPRGEVQPLLALALELRELGHEASLCAPPNFKNWIESFGVRCFPIGPDLEKLTAAQASGAVPRPSEEQMREAGIQMVHGQFDVFPEAARGCDLIVGGGALAIATRSVADSLGISYVFVAYCPVTFPTPEYPPLMNPEWLKMGSAPADPSEQPQRFAVAWKEDAKRFNHVFLAVLNERRTKLGLSEVDDVRRHIFTDRPWLCSDPTLAPAPSHSDLHVVQSGAWFLRDQSQLPPELDAFLAKGEPPVYFGFGSMAGSEQTGAQLIEAARACGFRAVIFAGLGESRVGRLGSGLHLDR